jgi:hypothetical protein
MPKGILLSYVFVAGPNKHGYFRRIIGLAEIPAHILVRTSLQRYSIETGQIRHTIQPI